MDASVVSSSIAGIFAVVPIPDLSYRSEDLHCPGLDAAYFWRAYARSTSFVELPDGLVGFVEHSDELEIAPIRTGLDATTP